MLLQKYCSVVMERKLTFGVRELSCTFFSVVYLHFGLVNKKQQAFLDLQEYLGLFLVTNLGFGVKQLAQIMLQNLKAEYLLPYWKDKLILKVNHGH